MAIVDKILRISRIFFFLRQGWKPFGQRLDLKILEIFSNLMILKFDSSCAVQEGRELNLQRSSKEIPVQAVYFLQNKTLLTNLGEIRFPSSMNYTDK